LSSPNGLYNLSKLSVWWLRSASRWSASGRAVPNKTAGMSAHLTLKKEATKPPGKNILQQQARFDAFVREFNQERPHEALNMKVPADLYVASSRPIGACTRPSTISRRTLTKPVSRNNGKRHQTQFTAGRTVTDCCLTKGVQSTMS
jgi:hypothetical protein